MAGSGSGEWAVRDSNPRPSECKSGEHEFQGDAAAHFAASSVGVCTSVCTGNEDQSLQANSADQDARLTRIISAWPALSDAIKAGILAMVETAAGPGTER